MVWMPSHPANVGRFLILSPLTQYLSPNLLLAIIVPPDNNDDFIADYKLRVLILI